MQLTPGDRWAQLNFAEDLLPVEAGSRRRKMAQLHMNPVIPSQAGQPIRVPIRVVGEPDTTFPEQFATFFWLDASGEIANTLQTVPIQDGVALYSGDPLPEGARWAITVHDAESPPHFRSGPLHRLPSSFPPIAFGTRISAFRASGRGAFALDSEDGFSILLRQRLAQLPSAFRVDGVQLNADNAGHEVVVVTGELRRFFFFRIRFTYSLALTIRPGTHPGRPQEIVLVEPAAAGTGTNLGGFRAVLDQAIVEGVRNALNGAYKFVAGLEFTLFGIDFPADLVTVSDIELTPFTSGAQISAKIHAGAVLGDTRSVVFERATLG